MTCGCCLTLIFIGNRIIDRSSNPEPGCLRPLHTNVFVGIMNSFLFSQLWVNNKINKIDSKDRLTCLGTNSRRRITLNKNHSCTLLKNWPCVACCLWWGVWINAYIYVWVSVCVHVCVCINIYIYIYIYIYIIIIIMSCRQHGYPLPSLATSPYHSSAPAGLQGSILCTHIDAVCKFKLVVLLLVGHMWGSIGVHHLWARPCFSSSVLRVWFV